MKTELTNKKFGKWTVIRHAPEHQKTRDRVWECKCECGNRGYVKSYYLTGGYSTQCVTCGHKPKIYSEELAEPIWNRIVSGAKRRGYKILLSKEEALQIFKKQNKKCALSGLDILLPTSDTDIRKKIATASLDRIDSSKDYLLGNVQWVHKDVNRMKNVFTQERFLEICKLIYEKNKTE